MSSRKHFLTIAQNGTTTGTILEASATVTGVPTELLLLTSVYDSIYEEDLPSFLCIKTHFWDKQQKCAEVYIRRRSVNGVWIWLLSKAVGFVTEGGIFAIVIEEVLIEEVELSVHINKLTKVVSVLIQAVEATCLIGHNNNTSGLAGDTKSCNNNEATQQPSFDPTELVETARHGIRLDLGLTALSTDDVKVITLVLSGKIAVQQIIPLMKKPVLLAFGLRGIVEANLLESDDSKRHLLSDPTKLPFRCPPPPISVLNLSCTYIGDVGIEMLSEVVCAKGSALKTLDLSYCCINERGFSSLAGAIIRRNRNRTRPLKCLILSGNYVNVNAAYAIGGALATEEFNIYVPYQQKQIRPQDRYNTTNVATSNDRKLNSSLEGLLVLHMSNTSMTAHAAFALIKSLGNKTNIREFDLSSNVFGSAGAKILSELFTAHYNHEGVSDRELAILPFLERLDLSNNGFGDEGATEVSKAFQNSRFKQVVDLRLSFNEIGPKGIESVMSNLLHHNLKSLSIDKNAIGDSGCQLVAASLLSMKALCRLNLAFNQIGSRGVTSLMRSLLTSESITYLGLSGNMLKISGSMALAFVLAQHPRLEELDVDNCCLDEASQCHIVAGIISNRLVAMKRLKGFSLGQPMTVIQALDARNAQLGNEECLKIRLNEQMRTFLQWMESNRISKQRGGEIDIGVPDDFVTDFANARFLTPEFVASINDLHGAPSQNPYCRLLGWLSRIPFYEQELASLQKFFYENDGGEGGDVQVNIRFRNDILAALDTETAEGSIDEMVNLTHLSGEVGIDIDDLFSDSACNDISQEKGISENAIEEESGSSVDRQVKKYDYGKSLEMKQYSHVSSGTLKRSSSSMSQSNQEKEKKAKTQPRISLFPRFEQQLAELKSLTTDLIEKEEDPQQHEIILTQYAEAVLVILRQLRYLCMNCGLDGWRRPNLKRKILIVDDTSSTRKLVARAFENANFIVDTASNGAEGVKMLIESLYDIVFMDIEMPIMDGLEATKRLRSWEDENRPGARQPICALTGKDTNQKQLLEIKAAGIDVIEKKPCHIPRLFKVVDDVSPMFSDLNMNIIKADEKV